MHAAEATLALRRNDARLARQELGVLLADKGDIGWRHALAALAAAARIPKLAGRCWRTGRRRAIPTACSLARLRRPGAAAGAAALAEPIIDEVVRASRRAARRAAARQPVARSGKTDDARRCSRASRTMPTDEDMRMSIAAEYDAMGDSAAAAACWRAGRRTIAATACAPRCCARRRQAALGKLYDELKKDSVEARSRAPPAARPGRRNARSATPKRWSGIAACPAAKRAGPRACAKPTCCTNSSARRSLRGAARPARAMPTVDEGHAPRDAYLLEAESARKDAQNGGRTRRLRARAWPAYPDDSAILYSRAPDVGSRPRRHPRAPEAVSPHFGSPSPTTSTAAQRAGLHGSPIARRGFAEGARLIDRARAGRTRQRR
jgi:hypothetical protein